MDSIPKRSSWSTVGSRSIADQDLLGVCVCVEVLRPSQPNGVMSSAVSLPNHTFTGQAESSNHRGQLIRGLMSMGKT